LFALEDGSVAERPVFLRSIGGHISSIAALWKGNFERGDRIPVFLGPKKREAF
jgi:hypothetical protein